MLKEIINSVRIELETRKNRLSLEKLKGSVKIIKPAIDFLSVFKKGHPAIIAEVKRASPSKGWIKEDINPVLLSEEYERGGADAISVLTEGKYFRGSLNYLKEIKSAVNLPVLCKDFIIDEYQVWEARAHCADSILIIVRILSLSELKSMIEVSRSLGMEPLVEVHTEEEAEKAILSGAKVIGINNRDLDTFQVNKLTTKRIAPILPDDCVKISESGIETIADIKELLGSGVNGFLIGESIVRAEHPYKKIRELTNCLL